MANATFRQVQQANDFTVLADSDVIPGVQSPYGVGDDGGYTGATIKEAIRDVVAAFLTAGTDISVVHDDPGDTLTVNFTGTLYTDEAAQDAVGAMVDSTLTYNDATPSLGVADGGITPVKVDNTGAFSFGSVNLGGTALADANVLSQLTGNAGTNPQNGDMLLQKEGNGSSFAIFYLKNANDTANTGGPFSVQARSRGTLSTPGDVVSGDWLGGFSFRGYGNGGFQQRGLITGVVESAPSGSSVPTYMSFYTGVTGIVENFRISSAGACHFPNVGTTASAANAVLDSGASPANSLLRSTSSARYKQDVTDVAEMAVDSIVDGLRPIRYRSRAPADNPAFSYYGFIAEEVAQVDPRLVSYGYHFPDDYDEIRTPDGAGSEVVTHVLKGDATLKPDGVDYARLTVILLKEVQRLRARLTALESAQSSPLRSE